MRPQGAGADAPLPALRCPSCGRSQPAPERFCPECQLPLVPDPQRGTPEVDERHERARKIKPQLAEGAPVRIAGARNQAEAELLQGLLLEAGIPSMLRRSAGFDVPDFLAAGPRDVLVAQSAVQTAREVLLEAELIDAAPAKPPTSPLRLLAGLVAVFALGAVIIWVGTAVIH